jgi:hypothetical protein
MAHMIMMHFVWQTAAIVNVAAYKAEAALPVSLRAASRLDLNRLLLGMCIYNVDDKKV